MFISSIDNCPHFSLSKFIDYNTLQYFSFRNIFDGNEDEDEEYNPNMKLVNLLFYNNNLNLNSEKQNEENASFESLFHKNNIIYNNNINTVKEEHIYFLCLSCGEILRSREDINNHIQKENHYIAINLADVSIWCLECVNLQLDNNQKGTPINLSSEQISLIKNHIQYLREKNI